LVPLDQLITALTNGVLIFSELEGLANQLGDPNDAVSSRTRWARKEHELDKLVSRLTGFKTSMALMLGILQW
jgi:cell division control protein 24